MMKSKYLAIFVKSPTLVMSVRLNCTSIRVPKKFNRVILQKHLNFYIEPVDLLKKPLTCVTLNGKIRQCSYISVKAIMWGGVRCPDTGFAVSDDICCGDPQV